MSRPTDGYGRRNGNAAEVGGLHHGRGTLPGARLLLPQDVFSRLVLVERRRSERSDRPFGILVLGASVSLDPSASPLGRAVLDGLVAATRETDLAGWIVPSSVLGVLLPGLPGSGSWAAVEGVLARIERALAGHPGAAGAVTLGGALFPEAAPVRAAAGTPKWSTPAVSDALGILESLVYPEFGEPRGSRRRAEALKRGLDIVGSMALLVTLAPLGLLIAGLVRVSSPGPVLFRQVRIGYRGRPFTMLKFRTMYVGTDEAEHREFMSRFIGDGRRAAPTNGAAVFKLTNDARVTALGHLLRKTSLDELPQFWNVLRGKMSLVGPRPPLPYELEKYAPWHRRRVLEARPGITGPWQVWGRSRTTFNEMVRLDLRYARTRSLWNDLRILLATPRAAIFGKGAH